MVEDAVEIITQDIQRIREYMCQSKIIAVVRRGDKMPNRRTLCIILLTMTFFTEFERRTDE